MTGALDALVIGESLIDRVEDPANSRHRETPGGSPLNVAVALGRLGLSTALRTQLGADRRGRRIRAHAAAAGVSLVGDADTLARTSTSAAVLDADGAAQYAFDIEWSVTPMGAARPASRIIHTGSLAAFLAPGCDSVLSDIRDARRSCLVSFDPNIRPRIQRDPARARDRAEQLVALADVVKASDEDIRWLYPGVAVDAVLEHWVECGAGTAVATLGASGAIGLTRSSRTAVPAAPANVVDTVGAGDSFTAGLLAGLAPGRQGVGAAGRGTGPRRGDPGAAALARALEFAARCAAATVSRAGADPPRLAELAGALSPP